MLKQFFCILLFLPYGLFAQISPFQHHQYRPYDRYVHATEQNFHTAIQPYSLRDLKPIVSLDTLYTLPLKHSVLDYTWNGRFITHTSEDFNFTIQPAGNFEFAQELRDTNTSWINSRGFIIHADITEKVHIYTSFYEIQSHFFDHRRDRIAENKRRVFPGQGLSKGFGDKGGRDYAFAEASVLFEPTQFLDISFGHGKHVIGDGYRSVLLSDNSPNYPFLKTAFYFGRFKYVSILAQHSYWQSDRYQFKPLGKTWNASHYLSWNATPWFSAGLFHATLWGNVDEDSKRRGFIWQYAQPFDVLRSPEYQTEDSHYALTGLNLKFTPWRNHIFYTQFAYEDAYRSSLFSGSDAWDNRYAFQLGYKSFNIAGISHLDVQTELNYARPFMYAHNSESQQYGHAQQPLAHPRGANFYESVSFLRYNYNRWFFEGKVQCLVFGRDTAGTNYGNDIFKSPNTRSSDSGHALALSGEHNTVWYKDVTVSYLINPHNAMNISFGISHRTQSSVSLNENRIMYFIAFRTSLYNAYYDF